MQLVGPDSVQIACPIPIGSLSLSLSTYVNAVSIPAEVFEAQGPSGAPSVHPMVTRFKDGASKPKLFFATCYPIHAMSVITTIVEPTCFSTAVKSLE